MTFKRPWRDNDFKTQPLQRTMPLRYVYSVTRLTFIRPQNLTFREMMSWTIGM